MMVGNVVSSVEPRCAFWYVTVASAEIGEFPVLWVTLATNVIKLKRRKQGMWLDYRGKCVSQDKERSEEHTSELQSR